MARKRKLGLFVFVPAMTLLLAWFSELGGQYIFESMPDRENADLQLWVQTRDSAPGDGVAIRLRLVDDNTGSLKGVRASVDGHDVPLAENPGDFEDEATPDERDRRFVLTLPATAHAVATLEVATEIATRSGDVLPESIVTTVPVVSAGARTVTHVMYRAAAVLAWLLVAGFAFGAVWWTRNSEGSSEIAAAPSRFRNRIVARLILLAVVAFGVAGQFVFVGPIVRTTTWQSSTTVYVLHLVWLLGVVAGIVAGYRARALDAVWRPVKIRAVIGTQVGGDYRQPASTLPATLSREAQPRTCDEIAEALRGAGYSVEARRRALVASIGGSPAVKIRRPRGERERPEGLVVAAHESADAGRAMSCLAALFGPLECKLPGKAPVLVDPAR